MPRPNTFRALLAAGFDLPEMLERAEIDPDQVLRANGIDPELLKAGDRPAKRVLHYRDLETMGLGSRTKIWRQVRNGKFPKPDVTTEQGPRWKSETIERFLDSD